MALTIEQESALLALLTEKRTTLPELSAATEVAENDLFLINQQLADKSVTAGVIKQFISPTASTQQQGIVQLSNALDSDSETIAATSLAIKNLASQRLSVVDGDNRYLQINNSPKFTILYPKGTPENPGVMITNQRLQIENPFASDSSFAIVELFINGIWGDPHYVYSFTDAGRAYGTKATLTGMHIFIVSGNAGVACMSNASGNPFNLTSNIASAPFRVKVWKFL